LNTIIRFFYNFFLYGYYFSIKIFAILGHSKAKLWANGRKINVGELESMKGCIWFHASSLGEFEQVSDVIKLYQATYPKKKILVTFFSPSGYEIKKNIDFADSVCYLPFDFKSQILPFIDAIEPSTVVWVRYEFWLHTLSALASKKIPVILVNGVFRKEVSIFYKPILKQCLACFRKIYVISASSKNQLKKLGFDSEVLFDSRYDRMEGIAQNIFQDEVLEKFVQQPSKTIVCGSIWEKDDMLLINILEDFQDYQWILAPHHVNSKRIAHLKNKFPKAWLWSDGIPTSSCQVLILDTIGILSKVYRYGSIAYIGGGFDKVVHSLVEPLAYGCEIIIGPHIAKSEEATEFVGLEMTNVVHNSDELKSKLSSLRTTNLAERQRLKKDFFKQRLGANNKLINDISKIADL
jgi:3-deoxy-D-manno-octulosonic-acid transferase